MDGHAETASLNTESRFKINYFYKMKNLLFALIAIFTLSNSTFANNNPETEGVKIELSTTDVDAKEQITLEFKSINDLKSFDENQISELFGTEDDLCEVSATVTVSGTVNGGVNVGVASGGGSVTVTVSATVTASCAEIKATVAALIEELSELVSP